MLTNKDVAKPIKHVLFEHCMHVCRTLVVGHDWFAEVLTIQRNSLPGFKFFSPFLL
jgi:hypothetical protein